MRQRSTNAEEANVTKVLKDTEGEGKQVEFVGKGDETPLPKRGLSVDAYEYQHHKSPAEGVDSSGSTREGSHDAVDYKHFEDRDCFMAGGELPEKAPDHEDGATAKFWNDNGSHKDQPSKHIDMSPEKARTILHDKEVRGHPLSPAQRGLFGAIASKGKK